MNELSEVEKILRSCEAICATQSDPHKEMVARLRRLANEIDWANRLYDHGRNFAWNSQEARYEADYLEQNP